MPCRSDPRRAPGGAALDSCSAPLLTQDVVLPGTARNHDAARLEVRQLWPKISLAASVLSH